MPTKRTARGHRSPTTITKRTAVAIVKAHKRGVSYEKLEPMYGLTIARGKTAWRIIKSLKKA